MGGTCTCFVNDGAIRVSFELRPFARGEYRRAHHGRIESGPKRGNACVVKTYKSARYANFQDDIKIAKIAKQIADSFNGLRKQKKKIRFVVPQLGRVTETGLIARCCCAIDVGDTVTVEEFIPGTYEKFVSNNGTYKFAGTLTAFSHFSYHASKERLLICDLQGVRNERGYVLTDPSIHSIESLGTGYGELDLGSIGIEAFFSTHKCEKVCRDLAKPAKARYTTRDVEHVIRDRKRSAYVAMGSGLDEAAGYA